MDMTRRFCVLLSGGLDSTAALYWAHWRQGADVRAISFRYGQRNADHELYAAGMAAAALDVACAQLVLGDALLTGVGLVGQEPGPRHPAVVPGRNLVFLTIAAAHAATWWPGKSFGLVVGANREDREDFLDCRPEFFDAAEHALQLGHESDVTVFTPWVTATKREILAACGVPTARNALEQSWSCYEATGPCGKCDACLKRKVAFDAVGWKDRSSQAKYFGGDPVREVR